MEHFDEEILLKYELELLTAKEEQSIKNHLTDCVQCTEIINQINNDVKLIGNYDPAVEPAKMQLPLIKKRSSNQWLKVAAILLIGFFAGFFSSNLSNPEKVIVVRQSVITKTASQSAGSFKSCEQVDLGINY